MLNRVHGPMSRQEYEEHCALLKSFRERVKQLRMYDGDLEDVFMKVVNKNDTKF